MNGYEYVKQLKAKIAESPTHRLSLQDSLDFIKFYGLRNLIGSSGDMRFVGQVAIDVLDKALSDELIISKNDIEQVLFSYVKKKSFDDNVVHEIMQKLDCMKEKGNFIQLGGLKMEKAKPCPFCGSEIRITKGVYNAPFWFFKCTNRQCGAVISFDNDKANICPDDAIYNYNARRAENG